MSIPEVPWYGATEKALRPLERYTSAMLIALAIIALFVAFRGDNIHKMALLIWLASP